MAKQWHRKHISTKWGVIIICILLLGLLIGVSQIDDTQTLFSRAANIAGNEKGEQYKQPITFTNLFARQDRDCKRLYKGVKLLKKKELEALPAQANVGNICRDGNGRLLNVAKIPKANGIYEATSFGCSPGFKKDPNDDCHAKYQGSKKIAPECNGSEKLRGPDCEKKIKWFSANTDQYGPGALLKVTNPANGKAVVVRAIDRGPGCSVQDNESEDETHAIFDMSMAARKAIGWYEYVKVERAPKGSHLGPCAEYWFE